jgi:Mg/Co/Ni transporter MgtE
MEKFNGEQTEPIKITTAIEDIIEVIKRNETSEVKSDILLLAEQKLKKETNQRFLAHRIGKIDVIRDVLIKQSISIKEMLDELKTLAEPSEYDEIVNNFINKII